MEKTRILIVTDKPNKVENVVDILKSDEYSVMVSNNINGFMRFSEFKPQLVLFYFTKKLDICIKIRKNKANDDVLIGYVNNFSNDFEITAYKNGVDDCFKFYDTYVRVSYKIKGLLRRKNNIVIEDSLKVNGVEIRAEDNSVFIDDKHIILSTLQFKILQLLMIKQDIIVNKDIIKRKVWGSLNVSNNTLSVHVKNIKYKIGDDKITCHDTLGYKFSSK